MSQKNAVKPKSYVSIASEIKKWILQKKYNLGDKIPTILGLHEKFQVAPLTIKRAINILKKEGVIEARRGIGITVVNNIPTLKNVDLVVFMPSYILKQNAYYSDINSFVLYTIFQGITEEANKLGILFRIGWYSRKYPLQKAIQKIETKTSHLTWYVSSLDLGGITWVKIKKEQKQRVVFINTSLQKFSGKGISIISDYKKGIEDAVEYYYHHGKRKFAIIHGDKRTKTHKVRYNFYVNALKEKGIKIPSEWQVNCIGGEEDDGYNAAEILYKTSNRIPEVIFCATDYRAIGVKRFFMENKLLLPCILGFDNISLGIKEKIDTIDIRLDEIGRVAVRSISDYLNKKITQGHEISVSSKFVFRGSI